MMGEGERYMHGLAFRSMDLSVFWGVEGLMS
jgi:hypothetical protein